MVELPDEIPEVFSCVLEYLYKGDYYPRLLHNKRKNTWELEDDTSSLLYSPTSTHARSDGGRSVRPTTESTVYDPITGQTLLKDTLIYCVAEKYGLDSLKRLALRKQGLQSGIQCATILSSARYAYEKTPDSDSKLRAHYLALIIRSRGTFKRSGTMQQEMERGGTMFFDLFVAMCNHMVSALVVALAEFRYSHQHRTTSPRSQSRHADNHPLVPHSLLICAIALATSQQRCCTPSSSILLSFLYLNSCCRLCSRRRVFGNL
jgi:hypothetical protein